MNVEQIKMNLAWINNQAMTPANIRWLWDLDQAWMRGYAHKRLGEIRDQVEMLFTLAHAKRRAWEGR